MVFNTVHRIVNGDVSEEIHNITSSEIHHSNVYQVP